MKFKIDVKGELPLYSTNTDLEERWLVTTPKKLQDYVDGKWMWFKDVVDPDVKVERIRERTQLYLGYDKVVDKAIIIKVLQYTGNDLSDVRKINKKRDVLRAQIELLNDISSPLLPEPLDWFEVKNTVDSFPKVSQDWIEENGEIENEPVLVLDYQPGISLEKCINENNFRRVEFEKNKRYKKSDDIKDMNIPKVGRLISYINYFLKTIYEKGYMYVGLPPEHILLLKDDVPRFIGLGSICRLKDGKLDSTHINFSRTKKGYSAPELNSAKYNYGMNTDAKAVGAFTLGVLLAQILYESSDMSDDILENGSFKYPNNKYEGKIKQLPKGDMIHDLLGRLCNPDPSQRLCDFDEIDEILSDIRGDNFIGSISRNNIGEVKFYNNEKGYGYIIDHYFEKDFPVSAKVLKDSGLQTLKRGQNIKFDLIKDNGREYIRNITVLENGEKTISKRQEEKARKQKDKKIQEQQRLIKEKEKLKKELFEKEMLEKELQRNQKQVKKESNKIYIQEEKSSKTPCIPIVSVEEFIDSPKEAEENKTLGKVKEFFKGLFF